MSAQADLCFDRPEPPAPANLTPPPGTGREEVAEAFSVWVRKQGGRYVMGRMYARAANFYTRYTRTGQRISIRLLWELVRWLDLIPMQHSGKIDAATLRHEGYTMNNNFCGYAERSMVAHKPEWSVLFEERSMKGEQ